MLDAQGFPQASAWTQNPTANDGTVSILDFEQGFFEGSKIFRDLYPQRGWGGFGTAIITRANNTFLGRPCLYLDGSGARLFSPYCDEYIMGSGSHCIEGWVFPTSFAASQTLVTRRLTSALYSPFAPYIAATGGLGYLWSVTGSSWALSGVTSNLLTLNSWNHWAVVRDGNTGYAYVNGVSGGTGALSGTLYAVNDALSVGANGGGDLPFTGWIGPQRITKGAAVYPGGTSFSPPFSFRGPDVR